MPRSWPTMERRGPVVDEAAVQAFEVAIDAKLPDDFREFLLDVNGGRTGEDAAVFAVGRDQTNLNSLLSLNDPADARDLAKRNATIRADLPPELLLIGNDDGGARICLCIRGDHRGEVWYFDTSNRRSEGSNPRVLWHDRRDLTKLADSFAAFMASLQPL